MDSLDNCNETRKVKNNSHSFFDLIDKITTNNIHLNPSLLLPLSPSSIPFSLSHDFAVHITFIFFFLKKIPGHHLIQICMLIFQIYRLISDVYTHG